VRSPSCMGKESNGALSDFVFIVPFTPEDDRFHLP
jgi:hypothetical protein